MAEEQARPCPFLWPGWAQPQSQPEYTHLSAAPTPGTGSAPLPVTLTAQTPAGKPLRPPCSRLTWQVRKPRPTEVKGSPRLTVGHRKSWGLPHSEAQRLAPEPLSACGRAERSPHFPGAAVLGSRTTPSPGLCSRDGFEGTGSGAPSSLGVGGQCLAGAREPMGTHITGQLLVVFHELFILLVDGQHLADTIGCCLRLATGQRGTVSH